MAYNRFENIASGLGTSQLKVLLTLYIFPFFKKAFYNLLCGHQPQTPPTRSHSRAASASFAVFRIALCVPAPFKLTLDFMKLCQDTPSLDGDEWHPCRTGVIRGQDVP